MNLAQLRFAQSLARKGSFTAAASECRVTQPTLSNAIAQLEEELGSRLFVRTTRSVALTPFGAYLLPCIDDVLSAQSTLVLRARSFLKPEKSLIRIGSSPLLSSQLLAVAIEPFKRQNPNVDIVLREMNMSDLHRKLDDGQLDFVFGVTSRSKGSLETSYLYSEALFFIPSGSGWTGNSGARAVAIKDIASEIYVMVPDACGLAQATRALFRSHRRKLQEYSGEAMSYQVLEQWANLGIGAAIMPKSKLSANANNALPILDKGGAEAKLRFEASWKSDTAQSGPRMLFAKHLREVVPAIASGL